MMEVIRDMGVEKTVGFKPAGGVRSAEDAQQFLAIADELFGADWADSRHYRFGASSLLASLLKALVTATARAPAATNPLICRMALRLSGLRIDACRPDKALAPSSGNLFSLGGYRVSRTRNYS